jgi:sec-independent protein translocase protein TatA
MFGSLGPGELIVIFFILVLLFGAKKLPQLGEGIGKALKNFKQSVNEGESQQPEKKELKNEDK